MKYVMVIDKNQMGVVCSMSQPKCTSAAGEECPDGFGRNEDGQCFPEHYNRCPEGYHSVEDDESGQCYSNDEECPRGTTLNEKHTECDIV